MRRVVEYHSAQWAALVETGWITATVDDLPDGRRVATMIWSGGRR